MGGIDISPIIEAKGTHEVKFPNGTLKGLAVLDGKTKQEKCYRYGGIRFAKPPLGHRRWRRPEPLDDNYDYSGDYTGFGTICPQPEYATVGMSDNPEFQYDEDCLFANIWVPAGPPPEGGWPVMFFIHGGFLQVGNPHQFRSADPQDLLAPGSPARYIVVSAGYRLNLFGFLSGQELLDEDPGSTNFGFWDQRIALEWTYKYIKYFGGNPNNIAIGGLSAGSYSAIFQIAYELYHPEEVQIIKRAQLVSNGLAVQPKTVEESQEQFNELLKAFDIPLDVSSKEKTERLRGISFTELRNKIPSLTLHTFRAVTDGEFVSKHLLRDIITGEFGRRFKASNRTLLIGEVNNEPLLYSTTNPPKSAEHLDEELHNYYPEHVVKALRDLYPRDEQFQVLFGRIVSDMQVYSSSRVLVESMFRGGATTDDVLRYRVEYRAKFFDKYVPRECLVPHAGDMGIWFYNAVDGITEDEKPAILQWLAPLGPWMHGKKGKEVGWGTTSKDQYRVFNADSTIEIKHDQAWDWSQKVRQTVAKSYEIEA